MMAAADMAGKPEAENPCCRAWKEKYSKLEQKRYALRQAVNILTPQIDAIQAENAILKKECEEEQARADNEKEGRLKESIARVSLENEISTLKSEIASLQKKARTSSLDRDQEVRLLQDRVSEREKEVNHLKELLEKEKKRADIKRKDDEKYRIQLEVLKKEADEAKSKLAAETLNLEQANKKLEAEKRKTIKERKHADLEMAKAEQQRKLAEANGKKVVEEKCCAENLSQQLEESRQRLEALQKEMHKVWSSRNLAPPVGQADNKLSPESTKTENRLQVDESKLALDLLKESNKKFEVEKQNAFREKKRAESERVKAEEQKKVAEVNWKKAIEEKLRADQLSQQLQEARRTIEELQKKMHELLSSRKLVEGSAVSPIKAITSENANVKFLKKQLKLEKMQVKQAKQVAKLEKSRSRILQQELGCLKLEFDQFARRLDLLNKSFSPSSEGIDDLEKIEYMQRLNMKKKKHFSLEPSWAHLQSDNEVVRPSCMDASGPFRLSLRHSVPSLPTPGGNFAESISGINYKLECPLGCSNWKMIQTSAINSSTASFSDGQLMGSQERGAFSVTTSAKLAKDNLNAEPTISNLSGEVTKLRCSEKSAEVAENNVKIPDSDDIGRGCEHIRKRKRVLDSIESIEYLYSKGRKLHMQIEEKLSFLHSMLGRQLDNPLEEGRCLASNLQCIPHAKLDGLHKKRKVSHEEVIAKHFCDIDERKNTENVETEVHEDASNLDTMGSFEDVVDGDYMKLLDLDNSADEERYRMALKMPLSPTLHNINFHGDEITDVNNSEALLEKWVNEGLSTDKESLLPTQSFGVIDFEINSNKLKHNVLGTSHNLLLHKNVGPACSFAVNGNGCSTTEAEKTSSHQISDSGLVVGMSNSLISRDEEVKFPFESELGSTHDIIPTYCVVFPNMRDCSIISRILGAVKTCIPRCCLLSQREWVVPKILLALKMEQNLLLMEKVCVFFTLLLLNLSLAAPRKFGKYLNGDSILCMDSFSRHMRAAMSDAETRSMFEDFGFLDELLNLIEEFLIDGRVMVYNNTSSETVIGGDSRIDFVLDGVNIMLLYEVAPADQLVAGSIILASICAAVDQIGIICEASYNIFRRRASDASLVLTIIHIFAYLGGQKFFSLRNYALMMTVLKSLVLLLEGVNLSGDAASCPSFVSQVQIQFHPCTKCPFSEGAVSVDTATSLLIELLQNCTALGTTNIGVIKSCNSLNSRVLFDNFKSEQGLSHEGVHYVAFMNCDASCSLDKYDIPTTQSDSIVDMTLCRLSDILSLVELLACSMSWDWTSIKMVPQLLKILELCVLENFAAAIIVLLGQLGRLGVDAGGYEDKGVENLRCNLSVFLSRDATRKAGLPIQIATVIALLGLLPLDFETLVQRNVKIQATASQSVLADSVTKWFSLLSKEQQDLSLKLLQTAGVKKK